MSGQEVQELIAAAGAALDKNLPMTTTTLPGINVSHFTGGPCAEPVAIGTAVGSGVLPAELRLMVAVAKHSRSGKTLVINPCGRCRQQMLDLSPGIKVVVIDGGARLKVVGILDLLPYAYIYDGGKEIEVAEA